MAKAAEAGGADVVSLINTLTGMKIDINSRTFALANKTGGMSGPAVKPVAVRMVYQVANAVILPIIGMGGIATAEDALEFIMAGATAVSVGTANFFNPYATVEMADGFEEFLEAQKVEDINELIGVVKGYCLLVAFRVLFFVNVVHRKPEKCAEIMRMHDFCA